MKLTGWICVLMGLGMAGCQRTASNTEEESTPPPRPIAAATPTGPILAPPGTFYVLVPVRKDTKDGVSRLTPGTEVKLIRPGLYETPIGPMELKPEMLTNDLTKAKVAQTSDAARQAKAYPKGVVAAAPFRAATPAVQMANRMNPAGNVPPAAAADEKVRAINFRLSVLRKEEARLAENSAYLQDKILNNGRATRDSPSGLSGSTSVRDLPAVDEKLAAVRAEIQRLEGALPKTEN